MMRILQRDALITVLVALAFMCRIAPANAADAPAPAPTRRRSSPIPPAGKWELVWSDDFNYNGLPDSTKWDYEEGYRRNHESQYYTRGRLENARVEGGAETLRSSPGLLRCGSQVTGNGAALFRSFVGCSIPAAAC